MASSIKQAKNIDRLDLAVAHLNSVVSQRPAETDLPPDLADNHGLVELADKLVRIRDFTLDIANGRLGSEISTKGYLPGVLKTLRANLNHLTWQTQRIAKGDYTQRVDFMGEFSQAFNSMVEQLDSTVKALRESEERYRLMAITDSLTGLWNRRHFHQLAEVEISRCRRHSRNMGLILLDIDNFKLVNDTHGHDVGDVVLQMVAATLKETTRPMDVPARWGGEEFTILLPETDRGGAIQVAERLRREMAARSVPVNGESLSVTASLGINVLEHPNHTCLAVRDELGVIIKGADNALYKAKDNGRNRVECAW